LANGVPDPGFPRNKRGPVFLESYRLKLESYRLKSLERIRLKED